MIVELSNLRALGFLLGLAMFVGIFFELRRHRSRRLSRAPFMVFSLLVMVVAAYPSTVNLPARFLGLDGISGGRLLALLLVSAILVWPVAIRNRSRLADMQRDLMATIRQFALLDFRSTYGEAVPRDAVWVVIPVLNERDNIATVVGEIPPTIAGKRVISLVVDDGSSDDSAMTARGAGAHVARLPLNSGGGAALHVGFDLALAHGALAVVTMDGDGQHDPTEIPRLVEPILAGEADFVIGSRIRGRHSDRAGLRALGVHLFSRLINVLMGTAITDCSSGFRGIAPHVLNAIQLREPQYHTPELIIATVKRGMTVIEAPIHIRARLSGSSKKGADLHYGWMFARSILRAWLR